MKISLVNFSGRNHGNCHGSLKLVEAYYELEHEVTVLELSDVTMMPCTKCHYECFDLSRNCPYQSDDIKKVYDTIVEADEAYYFIPNYNDYPCALFFIFNERGQGYFRNNRMLANKYLAIKKKFIVVSNTQQEHFRQALQSHITKAEEAEILFLASKEYQCSCIEGNLASVDEVKKRISDFITDTWR